MDIDDVKQHFRTPNISNYPELIGYTRDEIYEGKMGPGGLYLAALMARRLNLAPGKRVLDIGCGKGISSIFLAKQFDVDVVAVDLWVSATSNFERISASQMADKVVPLNLDISKRIPFAESYFDVVFCMDAIHYFGGNTEFWQHLLPHLKPGGKLCIGSPCFNQEFSAKVLVDLPTVYNDGTDLWSAEFSKYHSPDWWYDLLVQTNQMSYLESREVDDGVIYWEDDVLHNLEQGGAVDTALTDAVQITYREPGIPYLTHFMLYAEKA